MTTSTSEDIKKKAIALGFDGVGVASADLDRIHAQRLFEFLGGGRHGDMSWMETRARERASPTALWPEARSAVMVGLNYGPDVQPLAQTERRGEGAISVYARGADYHDVLKKKLKALASWLVDAHGGDVKVFVDTAPLMEKPLAQAAGVGWQGKHTNLVSTAHGSWLFLGALLTTLDLEADRPETDHCGSCRRCLEICPTNAFPAPYQLDARRCISYLTIEHKGPIPREFRAAIGNRIYGCDDCLAVCPWNKFARTASESVLQARDELRSPALGDLAALDDAAFRKMFSGSPIKRTGRDRFVRNALIAIGNSGDAALAKAARARLEDASPLVRGAAVWALERLLPAHDFAALRDERAPRETDETVREEWGLDATR
jgi:epoxyqueuosine reductase